MRKVRKISFEDQGSGDTAGDIAGDTARDTAGDQGIRESGFRKYWWENFTFWDTTQLTFA